MQLKSLELNGFKSFAKKTSFVFDSPITSIVGPNGSGKSNVAEAFRWVLGEQSLKSLRGKRGEDLIFNGSTSVPRMSKCSAAITFDNSKRQLNVDFDEVEIKREVYRDGVNEYYLNGSKVRLKDIIELLAAVSLGSMGHHIISQGEADKILNASVAERKAIIEEALGLKVYQWKISESEKKLAKTEENIRQVESLKREIAPHLKFLKKQVEKIEKADLMRKELKGLYLEYLKKENIYLEEAKSKIARAKAEPAAELAEIEAKLEAIDRTLKGASGDSEKAREIGEIEHHLREIRGKKDELARSLGRLEGMIEIKTERLGAGVDEEDRPISYKKVKNVLREIDYYASSGLLEKIRNAVAVFFEEFKNLSGDHEALFAEVEKLKADRAGLESESGKLGEEETRESGRLTALKASLEKEKEDTRGAEREAFELRARRSELRGALETVKAREEKIQLEENDFKREIEEGLALVDREILNYDSFVITDSYEPEEHRHIQEDRRRQIERIKIRLEDMGVEGTDVLEEYKEVTKRDEFLGAELEDLLKSKDSLQVVMKELKEKIEVEFKEGVGKINKEFQNFFALMFGGGTASLEVMMPSSAKATEGKPEDLLSELNMEDYEEKETKGGIDVNVSLPRKKTKGLQMLSGGERALTSIALLFAMSQVNPPPFLILDETDAALDEANSRKYGDMIASLSKFSQLILITHNRETMARAGIIYGVTMGGDGISRLLSIKLDEAESYAK